MSKGFQPKEVTRGGSFGTSRVTPPKSGAVICEVIGLGTVRNSGKDHEPGELLELSREEADRAIALGCVKEA